ncbi:ATP-binding protein [Marimonas sp. MJW-29]|uniref:histidine kinase n=1 Tax=Sulfitobacter sediminis TaxID=3234186 RepID=A0ABV3RGL7_9RHOB
MNLNSRLTEERRRRLAAERLLELRQAELAAANRKLGQHAQHLSEQVVETRAQNATILKENRRVKLDLSAVTQRAEVSERRLWHPMQSIDGAVALFDSNLELVIANDAYLAVFEDLEAVRPGVSYVTLIQLLTDEGIVEPGDMTPDAWREMMINRLGMATPEQVTIRLWNGEYARIIDQRSPEGDLVSLCFNVTERIAYEEKLKKARMIAESANRAKSAFLANMTHELRSPMNGVIGMVDLLRETALNEEQRAYAETIKHSAEALLVIINDVLDYSKIEAERISLKVESFELGPVLQDVMMLFWPTASEKGVDLVLDADPALPERVIGDAGRLRQVLTNLVGNAVKFTQSGHVALRISGHPDLANGTLQLRVRVEDTGIGIPGHLLGHIFGEFNQVEDTRDRSYEGTGLGLAISERLVKLMGGSISVTSALGEGACFDFQVTLKLEKAASAQARGPAATPSTPPSAGDPAPRPIRILAAEDNETNQFVFAKMLGGLNADVRFANDGEEAVRLFDDFGPDLVFMDISMPKMDGLAATRAIRTRKEGAEVPIIALTAHAHEEDRSAILGAGLTDILTKPLRKALIIARIETAHRPWMSPLESTQDEGSYRTKTGFSGVERSSRKA